jgi:hypothetical protein
MCHYAIEKPFLKLREPKRPSRVSLEKGLKSEDTIERPIAANFTQQSRLAASGIPESSTDSYSGTS